MLAQGGRCLLALDGLEKVQDDGARGRGFGSLLDGRLRALLLHVADGLLPGVSLLITSRFPLFDVVVEGSDYHCSIDVAELTTDAAVRLLRVRGVKLGTDSDLARIARDQGRHALSVDLIGGYIARFCEGNPAKLPRLEEQAVAPEDDNLDPHVRRFRQQERRFARVAERYRQALDQTDPAALALLQRVCLFRLGVDAKTLARIFTGPGTEQIAGPALSVLSTDQLERKLRFLCTMRLLETHSPNLRIAGKAHAMSEAVSIHPAVRDGFLRTIDVQTASRGHEAAKKGIIGSLGGLPGFYSNPSDLAVLDLLEEIVHHTLAAGQTEEAWNLYHHRIGAFANLGWRLGAYERGERICRAFAGGLGPNVAVDRSQHIRLAGAA